MPLTHEEIEKIQSMIQDSQIIKNATREELTTFIKVMATSLYDDEDFYGVDDYMRFINEIFKRNFDTKNTRLGINELKEEDKVFKNLRIAETPDEQKELNKEAMEWAKERIEAIKDKYPYETFHKTVTIKTSKEWDKEHQENIKSFIDNGNEGMRIKQNWEGNKYGYLDGKKYIVQNPKGKEKTYAIRVENQNIIDLYFSYVYMAWKSDEHEGVMILEGSEQYEELEKSFKTKEMNSKNIDLSPEKNWGENVYTKYGYLNGVKYIVENPKGKNQTKASQVGTDFVIDLYYSEPYKQWLGEITVSDPKETGIPAQTEMYFMIFEGTEKYEEIEESLYQEPSEGDYQDEEYEYHERNKQEPSEGDYNPEKHLIIEENRKAFVDGVLYNKVYVVEFEDSTKIICEEREDGNPKNEMIKVDELHYCNSDTIYYKTKHEIIWDDESNFHELVENYKSLFKVKDDESNQEFVTILEISKGFVGDVHHSRILIGKDSQGKIKAVFKSEDDERTLFIVEYDEEKQKFNDYLDDEIVFEGCDEYNQRYIKIKNEKVKWCEDEFYTGMRLYTNKFSRPVGKSPQQLGWDCALEMDKVKSQFLKLNQQNFGSKI